jgi:hypothetical protein
MNCLPLKVTKKRLDTDVLFWGVEYQYCLLFPDVYIHVVLTRLLLFFPHGKRDLPCMFLHLLPAPARPRMCGWTSYSNDMSNLHHHLSNNDHQRGISNFLPFTSPLVLLHRSLLLGHATALFTLHASRGAGTDSRR